MTMSVRREGHLYLWTFDSIQGVGRYVRKSDGHMTLMFTGSDAHTENATVNARRSPNGLDLMASLNDFHDPDGED